VATVTHPDVDPRWLPLLDLWHDDEDDDGEDPEDLDDQAHADRHGHWHEGCPDCIDRANRLEDLRP
jgi:hypothetical protein